VSRDGEVLGGYPAVPAFAALKPGYPRVTDPSALHANRVAWLRPKAVSRDGEVLGGYPVVPAFAALKPGYLGFTSSSAVMRTA
jgi:hypothetical protein